MSNHFTVHAAQAAVTTDTPAVGTDVTVLTGASNATLVLSLEVIAGEDPAVVKIIRKNAEGTPYATIKLDMTAYNYLMLWDDKLRVIPAGHTLVLNADSPAISVVANVMERTQE